MTFKLSTMAGVDDTQLDVLLGDEEQRLKVNITLSTVTNKGITVDTNKFRELHTQGEVLAWCEWELHNEWATWRTTLTETKGHLTRARVHTHLYPYLNHTTLIPDHYCPETMWTGGVTLAMALEDTRTRGLHWYTMPHLHDKEFPGNCPTHKPLPFPHHWRLCGKLQPKHTVWECPKVKDCHYCKAHNHTHPDCPNPHAECFYKSECVVPFTHCNNVTHNEHWCPATALHAWYYVGDYGYDGEHHLWWCWLGISRLWWLTCVSVSQERGWCHGHILGWTISQTFFFFFIPECSTVFPYITYDKCSRLICSDVVPSSAFSHLPYDSHLC